MTYTYRTRQELQVCPDCIYVSANGAPDYDGYADSGHAERYAQGLAEWGDEPFSTSEETHFSWQPCDFCGDRLGGDRYESSLMQLHTTV
jgi:hypothetical protein